MVVVLPLYTYIINYIYIYILLKNIYNNYIKLDIIIYILWKINPRKQSIHQWANVGKFQPYNFPSPSQPPFSHKELWCSRHDKEWFIPSKIGNSGFLVATSWFWLGSNTKFYGNHHFWLVKKAAEVSPKPCWILETKPRSSLACPVAHTVQQGLCWLEGGC